MLAINSVNGVNYNPNFQDKSVKHMAGMLKKHGKYKTGMTTEQIKKEYDRLVHEINNAKTKAPTRKPSTLHIETEAGDTFQLGKQR